jgi:ribosomal protein S4
MNGIGDSDATARIFVERRQIQVNGQFHLGDRIQRAGLTVCIMTVVLLHWKHSRTLWGRANIHKTMIVVAEKGVHRAFSHRRLFDMKQLAY